LWAPYVFVSACSLACGCECGCGCACVRTWVRACAHLLVWCFLLTMSALCELPLGGTLCPVLPFRSPHPPRSSLLRPVPPVGRLAAPHGILVTVSPERALARDPRLFPQLLPSCIPPFSLHFTLSYEAAIPGSPFPVSHPIGIGGLRPLLPD